MNFFPRPFKQPWLYAVLTVVLWGILMAAVIWLGMHRFNFLPDNAYGWMTEKTINTDHSWSNTLSLWDGRWYINLAKGGYRFDPAGLSNVAFLPLLPLLLRGFILATGSFLFGGLTINALSLMAAIAGLVFLAKQEKFSESEADESSWFFLLYPTAIFFAAIYTESLFCALSIWTFVFLKRRQYAWAGLVGMAAALTRIPGVFLVLPFAYELWQSRERWVKWLFGLLIPVGTLIYLLVQKIYVGNAFAFLTAQHNWGRNFGHWNPDHFYTKTAAGLANASLDALFVIFLLGAIVLVWKKLNLGYAAYTAAVVLVPLATGSVLSIGRFGMVLFPIALAMSRVKSTWIKRVYGTACIMLVAFYTIQFVNGYWAG